MARAKRTDRTEARRRHRAEQATLAADDDSTVEAEDAGSRHSRNSQASKNASSRPQRPGIVASMRAASRPVDWRSDFQSLPTLVRHWSFWVPASLAIACTVLFFIFVPAGTSTLSGTPTATNGLMITLVYFAFQMFVFPMPAPVGAAFLAGFAAPKASWLIGALVGLVAAICFAVIVLSPAYADAVGSQSSPPFLALQGLLAAPFGSALFASLAAWYRRFLNLANPNRSQHPPKAQRGRGNMKTNSRA